MNAPLYDEIDDVVRKLKEELYQKIPVWSQARSPSGLFDAEQELQKTLNSLQANIVRVVLDEIHRDTTFTNECQTQARCQCKVRQIMTIETPVRTLSGAKVRISTSWAWFQKELSQESEKKRSPGEGGVYPVLRRLGIVRGATPRLLAEFGRQMSDGPSGAEAIDRLANREIVCTQFRMKLRMKDLASIALWQRQQAVDSITQVTTMTPPPLAGKRVVVGLDGGRLRIRINKRGDDQVEIKEYTTGKCEAKLFAIYTIDEKGNKERGTEIFYDGTIQSAESIFALLQLRLIQLGIKQAHLLVITGDGARWIWKEAAHLPKALGLKKNQVVEVVDFAHSVGKLTNPAKLGIQGYAQQQKWLKKMRRLLKKGQVKTVIASLRGLDRSKDKENDIAKAIEYFQANKARMRYDQFRADGLPIGSGVIESGVSRIVNLRMKRASMFWLPENAESILYLRCQIKSGRWVTFVKSVLSQWAADMSVSLPQVCQIRDQVSSQFLESHQPVSVNSRGEIIKWACNLLEDGEALILDTETTGLSDSDEVIQLAIVDLNGDVLLSTLLKPTVPIDPEAYAVHGFLNEHLAYAPTLSTVYESIACLLQKRHVVAYNANFDQRLLDQTCERYGLSPFQVESWNCVMERYACFWGNRHSADDCKRQSLTAACTQQGIIIDGTHEAVKDCLLTLKLINAMADANEHE